MGVPGDLLQLKQRCMRCLSGVKPRQLLLEPSELIDGTVA